MKKYIENRYRHRWLCTFTAYGDVSLTYDLDGPQMEPR